MEEQDPSCKRLFAWTDSFSVYRAYSNENERIASAFSELVLPQVVPTSHLSWLDIGCGDCAKTAAHARLLWETKACGRVSVTLVDPHLHDLLQATEEYLDSIVSLFGDVRLLDIDLAQFTAGHEARQLSGQLVTAVHSVHTIATSEALNALVQDLSMLRVPVTVFVVTESAQSDFYRIRRSLERCGLSVPRPFTDELCEHARSIGAQVTRRAITDQYCRFNRKRVIEDDNYWLFPFLLGETGESYSARPPADRRHVEEVLREFITDLHPDQLSTPDEALLMELIV